MTKALVDTEIWSLAKKKPVKERFKSDSDYERALKIHRACRKFFEEEFENIRIYMSLHQIAEIFHVLAFRGYGIPLDEAVEIVMGIIGDESIVKVPVLAEHLRESLKVSMETGIHVWDFLCFIPLRNHIDAIYSLDRHFVTIGEMYGVRVINPAQEWLDI